VLRVRAQLHACSLDYGSGESYQVTECCGEGTDGLIKFMEGFRVNDRLEHVDIQPSNSPPMIKPSGLIFFRRIDISLKHILAFFFFFFLGA
jgi:hypothetical protein